MRVPGQPYEVGAWVGSEHKPGKDRRAPDSVNPDTAIPNSADARRVVVERLQPEIDGGRFPIKRTVGESVSVTVDLFADGHDLIAGVLKYRLASSPRWTEKPAPQNSADPAPWIEVPLTALGNDRWGASFAVTEPGEYEYTV